MGFLHKHDSATFSFRMPSSMAARVSWSSSSRMGAGFARPNLCAFDIGFS